jgi:hypothetical protein
MAAMRANLSDQHVLILTGALAGYNFNTKKSTWLRPQLNYVCIQQDRAVSITTIGNNTRHGSKRSNISQLIANSLRLFTANYTLSWSIYRPTTLSVTCHSSNYITVFIK